MFFVTQLIIILVAYLSSKEEFYATFPYRENIAPKGKESSLYHKWGAAHIIVTCAAFAGIAFGFSLIAVLNGLILGLWYWLLFDVLYAVSIKRDWFYLGNESSIDRWLKRTLGVKEAGKTKAYIVGGLIIIINLCYIFVR